MSRFARLLFTWMIAHADDWGVMVGEARRVRALVLPMDDDATDAEVDAALAEMEAQELIWRYRDTRGTSLLQFRTWETHQHGLHKRTAPKLPRYSDMVTESQAPMQELPGTSRNFPANVTELKGTEQKGSTPTVSDAATLADAVETPPADDSAPAARSSDAITLPDRLPSETTERAYWERVMKDLPSAQRIPTLVHLARDKIGADATPGSATYGRLGALARKHTASLVAVWIIQAAGQHIAGDPLDYLTKLATGQLEREARNNGGYAAHGRSAGAYSARDGKPKVGTPEYYAQYEQRATAARHG